MTHLVAGLSYPLFVNTRVPAELHSFEAPGDVRPRPHVNCYWLLPGRIIAGEYPRNFDDESSQAKLRTILAVGVTRFIDLTEAHELESYAELMQAEAARQGVTAKHERHSIRDLGVPAIATMRTVADDEPRSGTSGRRCRTHGGRRPHCHRDTLGMVRIAHYFAAANAGP